MTDILSGTPCPELAAAVRAISEDLTTSWLSAVRLTFPACPASTINQLRDDIPAILKYVASILDHDRAGAVEALAQSVARHDSLPDDKGFQLDEMMVGYGILRARLIKDLAAHLKRPLEITEFLELGAALDVMLRGAVMPVVEALRTQLQADANAQRKHISAVFHDLRGGLNGAVPDD